MYYYFYSYSTIHLTAKMCITQGNSREELAVCGTCLVGWWSLLCVWVGVQHTFTPFFKCEYHFNKLGHKCTRSSLVITEGTGFYMQGGLKAHL